MKTYKRKRGKDKVYRRYYGGNADDDIFHYAVCYKERCGGMLLLTRVTATSQLSCPRNMYSYNASIKIRKRQPQS